MNRSSQVGYGPLLPAVRSCAAGLSCGVAAAGASVGGGSSFGGDIVHVPLSCGRVALVDRCDLDLLTKFRWRVLSYTAPSGREYCYLAHGKEARLLHRMVLEARPGQFVDHIDGNGLNNARANLRLCTHSENMRNRRPLIGKKLPKGVQVKRHGFAAQIKAGAIRRYKAGFPTAEAAQRCYAEWARELHGEFAHSPPKPVLCAEAVAPNHLAASSDARRRYSSRVSASTR